MVRYRTYCAAVALAVLAGVLPAALASRSGADPGFNGGIVAFGNNCYACHDFNLGGGRVELLDLPQRYRPTRVYDLSVRIIDPQQKGAGFQVSAETLAGHQGTLLLSDTLRTDYSAGDGDNYVTHTRDGVDDSILDWDANGGSYAYDLAWQAPPANQGPITLFAAGNAINDGQAYQGDRYYAADATLSYAHPGDGDGDTDADLRDFGDFQDCFGQVISPGQPCDYVNMNSDNIMSLSDLDPWIIARTGPTATLPGGFVVADPVRGGRLYDEWWTVIVASPPTGDHPLYPAVGTRSGPITFRCKECHGWDYKGVDGAYGSGSHFTGIGGVFETALTPSALFDLLKADPAVTPNGHNMDAYGLSDRDLWDLVRFTLDAVVDTDPYIVGGSFSGNTVIGDALYSTTCTLCHGIDGDRFDMGDGGALEYVGTIANANPWEFLHKVRFGHPGSPMPATERLGWILQDAVDIGAHCETLPIN